MSGPSDFLTGLFGLEGKVAIVTGGGSGLGTAFAGGLAAAGATVVLFDLDEDGMAGVASAADRVRVDVTSKDAVTEAVAGVVARHGGVDVLVNSAGIARRHPAEDFPEDEYDAVLAVNLKGTFLSAQAVARPMFERGGGSIVNVASIGAFNAYPWAAAYQASKGGVRQLTKALALEWHDRGVRVNAIAPTLMHSPMTTGGARVSTVTSDFIIPRMLSDDLGDPADLVGAAIFLASGASALVTGHTLLCDDGYTIV
jgi:NAD(P)-dependent dehydrogenase (short-subunit alcohol dehydrogenase family)